MAVVSRNCTQSWSCWEAGRGLWTVFGEGLFLGKDLVSSPAIVPAGSSDFIARVPARAEDKVRAHCPLT